MIEPNTEADPNHAPLEENRRRLQEMTDLAGRPLEVVELPMPLPLHFEGQRLPASYANFFIANDRVLDADIQRSVTIESPFSAS